MGREVVVLDANVLYPARLRDRSCVWRSEALAPDEFVLRLVHQDLDAVVKVVDQQAAALRNPPMSTAELLDGLRIAGLPRTVAALLSGTA